MDLLRKFVAPEFVFGIGSLELAGQYADHMGGNRILLVADPGIRESGWCDKVEKSLQEKGMDYIVYDHIQPNPRDSQIMEGAEFYEANNCDVILALGGGSVLDAAKGIGIIISNGGAYPGLRRDR